ncbi:hypothetical protein PtA15_15A403 [Puccinia triticina]|uniref:Uncharacterized protein n=1 Tax=Puccinia triticina TaxID=208348 RepID=A0ABY7D309_9BASI|nr:uncharacterized protein PtA15_15A403 [Puccinia triticina]WAQ92009.1 hypothetical protein PtA15_15A403 [Puccinia triticina]
MFQVFFAKTFLFSTALRRPSGLLKPALATPKRTSLSSIKNNLHQIIKTRQDLVAPLSEDSSPQEVIFAIKRSAPQASVNLFRQFAEVLEKDWTSESALYLIRLLHKRQINVDTYFEFKNKVPVSFSKTTWRDLQSVLGLPSWFSIPTKAPQRLYISDDACYKIFEEIDEVELTVAPLQDCDNEAKVVLWVTSVIKTILLLFRGKINNDAQGNLPEAASSLGGRVEFLYTVLDQCIVMVTEAKRDVITRDDSAQLMVELESAHLSNLSKGLQPGVTRGIMCSRDAWEFWTYDANANYSRSDTLPTTKPDVNVSLKNLRHIFEATYHVFFEGYMEALEAFTKRSEAEQEDGKGLPKWKAALALAKSAFGKAKKAADANSFDDAVRELHESLKELPEEHNRILPGYSKAFKKCTGK